MHKWIEALAHAVVIVLATVHLSEDGKPGMFILRRSVGVLCPCHSYMPLVLKLELYMSAVFLDRWVIFLRVIIIIIFIVSDTSSLSLSSNIQWAVQPFVSTIKLF